MRLRYRGVSSGTYDLTGRDTVLIGRSMKCDLRTDDATLSRTHARMELNGEAWILRDLSSAHGTTVNGAAVSTYIMKVGEAVKLGDVEIVLEESPPAHAITVHDRNVATLAGQAITVGKAFAFVGPELMEQPSLRWLKSFVDPSAFGFRVIPLVGTKSVELPGLTVQPVAFPRFTSAIVASDKALYREGADTVNLCVVDPMRADGDVTLDVELDGARLTSRPLTLRGGLATAALGDLPVGRYAIRVRGTPESATPCTFTVATYKLSALVASMTRQRVEGELFIADLALKAFGTPVNGAVLVELMDDDERIGRFEIEATAGHATAQMKLTGDGPHSINVQLKADPSKTATVPIIGSRAADRSDTVFSSLGADVLGSLLPSDDAKEVRGVWLRKGATRTSPLMLRQSGSTATLIALSTIERLAVVISDPTLPVPAEDAIDARTAPHPISDYEYAQAEKLFQAGEFAKSLEMFAAARERRGRIHCNYAYYIACCHSRLGNVDAARAALRLAVEDGWYDMEHLTNDDDMALLRGDALFKALVEGPRVVHASLEMDQTLDIEVPAPVAVLAVGAYAVGRPWEGHATIVVPTKLALSVEAPERPKPAGPMTITVKTDASAAYVIVKDARLASTDTPASLLASRIKAHAASARNVLGRGRPTTKLADILPAPPPPPRDPRTIMGGLNIPLPMGGPVAGRVYSPSPAPMARSAGPMLPGSAMPPRPTESAPLPSMAPMMMQARPPAYEADDDLPDLAVRSAVASHRGAPPANSAPSAPPARTIEEAPEVIFAGVVPVMNGAGSLTVDLPEAFAEYVIEAFAVAGTDWRATTTRVRAELAHFATFELPAFVHPSDTAIGRLTARGGAKGITIEVTKDGASIPIKTVGDESTFLVGPGDYEAIVTDVETGEAIRTKKRVDVPGKLRRFARSIRFLSAGEKVALADDIVTLRVLPGLDKPFKLLTDATAEYGHACCEQTAAKILAACSMYLFAGDDAKRRAKAEEIILAGVRRERTMFLPRRGFKMYPDSGNEPNDYWGKKCARYLWNLDLLKAGAPSKALVDAIDDALEMARDATHAYGMTFPPSRSESTEDDYARVRFQTDATAREEAVSNTKSWIAYAPAPTHAVQWRTDAAYAAATLLRGGGVTALADALRLANKVVADIGPEGRLYSTCDSVAAIALMAELQAAKVVGGGGSVKIDGQTMKVAEAVAAGEVGEVAAVDGTVAVEVTRIVEEDWTKFSTAVPVTVLVTSGGRTTTSVKVGDAVDLTVRLDEGYTVGDLVWVALPDALSRVIGGGQVKRFSIDPQGRQSVTIPLAATGLTVDRNNEEAPQRFAVCVRNMFDEERAGNPGYLDLTVRG